MFTREFLSLHHLTTQSVLVAVVLSRADDIREADPVLGQFFDFLAHDIAAHTERLQGLNADWLKRINALVDGVDIDLDGTL